jgi:FkbM family methyltransferase
MVLEQQQQEQEKEFALCLNMIVKNESHVVKNTLIKLLQKIKFDYWVISDTGSTDETKEVITDFFKEVGIPGELYEDDWVDFSHNRNRALEYAFEKSKYLLVFDADDEICGNFVLPELTRDCYSLQFGSYTRPQIVNNHKRWKYVGVLHEYICSADSRIDDASTEIIKGPYHVISGRTGNRSLDSNKYLKDAIILEKAYHDAVNAKDDIYIRYGFYCANSYYDCGKYESAISWYKKTLENGGWAQEKYVSCLRLYNCYNNLDNKEAGFFYLVKSAEYDRERAECYYELITYYSGSGLHDVAYGYYGALRDFYRDNYLKIGLNNKLFVDVRISEFHLPYYVIIVCEKMRDYETGIHMYRIIFTKKCKIFDTWFVSNMLYNLQFFTEYVKDEDKTAFYSLFQEYVEFLVANNYPIFDGKHEFMEAYKKYGIVKSKREPSIDECSSSNKILIYTGFMSYLWNDTYISNHAMGGAEKAVAYLARNLPKEYEIIISGDVANEVVGNVRYVNRFKLQALLDVEKFHTIIVSRYVSFFLLFPRFHFHQLYLCAHDTGFLNNFNDVSVNSIMEENNKYINGVICLTTWHKLNIIQTHPCLKNKISIINNGILVPPSESSDDIAANANAKSNAIANALLHNKIIKIKNKFVWTSCSSRGLDVLLKLWDKILEVMPDATLDISSYDAFPNPNRNKDDDIDKLISHHSDTVIHHGKLNTLQLHDLISKAEYWLYTNTFYETSCITALEMLMHEVVCLYYPLAGLNETIGKYGIQVIPGTEIQSIMNLSEERKAEMIINGKKYAMSCSWENRAKEWESVLGLNSRDKENKVINLMKNTSNDTNTNIKVVIGFHSNQLCERGSDIALYDYAYYNQKLYGNKSIIFYCKHAWNNDHSVIKRFEKQFKCYAYDKFSEIDEIILHEKINYFYNIKSGSPPRNSSHSSGDDLVTNCPNLTHAVFTVEPHGEKYATVSKRLSSKYNNIVDYVPHMINLPSCNDNMRNQLNIHDDDIVIGRIGGLYQFDIEIAHRAIRQIVELDRKMFFLFVNTNKFYEHPQIIYIDRIIEPFEKVKFINTCDAMIHARSDGETFGLAVAEFSTLNKPIITCVSKIDNSHIEILGDKAIIFNSEESLIDIFKNIRTTIKSRNDWNAYKEYTPKKVMKKFMSVFIPEFMNNNNNLGLLNENNELDTMNPTYPTPKFEMVIINLKRRYDRRLKMEARLQNQNIRGYEFMDAVDGRQLVLTEEVRALFHDNDFNYNKGVIGCAMSHIALWKRLIDDSTCDLYVILEDDSELVDDFELKLAKAVRLFTADAESEYCHISTLFHLSYNRCLNSIKHPCTSVDNLRVIKKNNYEVDGTGGYIIKKSGAARFIDYYTTHSMTRAIDTSVTHVFNSHMCETNEYLIKSPFNSDSDIQICKVATMKMTVAFCDWWEKEYCGGYFELNNNFFTNLLREYCNSHEIKIINPSENPDILFYSIFGFSHENYTAGRKIFFSGEPYPQRDDAHFNMTFDENSFNNTRVPLWLCYFDKSILEECNKRKNSQNIIPSREKFCSFIASGPGLANNRKEFIEKLSKYKQVDCGGSYLNNIGYTVPLGVNCSGKIEHNNNYKFAMAFENTIYKGYVTEKICDVFKSNCLPIYWGHPDVVKDYNPKTFINANDFANFDELVDYIIKVDNDEELYKSFFKEQIITPLWFDILSNDTNKIFLKNLAYKIIGKPHNLLNNLTDLSSKNEEKYYSDNKIDEFLSTHIFKGHKNGYFMDVGANDGITINNTLYFEKYYNWTGINVEPLDEPYNKLILNRVNCINLKLAIDNVDGEADFIYNTGYTEMISGLKKPYDPRHFDRLTHELNKHGGTSTVKIIKTKTIKTILEENKIKHINYLSIDVEGGEKNVLESINFNDVFIDVISFEDNFSDTTVDVIKFMEANNYILVGRFGDIIMIHEKSNFIKNLDCDEIMSLTYEKFICYGIKPNIELKNKIKT